MSTGNPFGEALDAYLTQSRRSEADFARSIGVVSTQVHRWRKQGQKPVLDAKVAAALREMGKTVADLYPAPAEPDAAA